MKRLLFVTWDGPQVSYLEGLFLPILEGLRGEYVIRVVQFTWGDRSKSERIAAKLRGQGMDYRRVDIGPRFFVPLGILCTWLKGTFILRSTIRKESIDIVLFRSIYPGLMLLPIMGKTRKWVFDADGLPVEEMADFGRVKPGGLVFRTLKWVEGAAVRKADRVMVRSMKALSALPEAKTAGVFHRVLNGRDTRLFQPQDAVRRAALRREIGVADNELLLVYCGSLGDQYCLPEMLRLLEAIAPERRGRLMIVTGNPEYLDSLDPERRKRLLVFTLPAEEVSRYIGAADAALAIRRATPSMRAVSPIKLGEYLLCGLPVVASAGIGDSEEVMAAQPSCMVLREYTQEALCMAARWVERVTTDPDIRVSARKLGLEQCSLQASIVSYRKALEEL
jgi:glycosyltransferase involved in cell wall biosynthesis